MSDMQNKLFFVTFSTMGNAVGGIMEAKREGGNGGLEGDGISLSVKVPIYASIQALQSQKIFGLGNAS